METPRRKQPAGKGLGKQPPRKAKFRTKSIQIKRKQNIQPRIVCSCCSSSSTSQLRINCMYCQTNREDYSSCDCEASAAGGSLGLLAMAEDRGKAPEEFEEAMTETSPQNVQCQEGQKKDIKISGKKWKVEEQLMLLPYVDSSAKIEPYFMNKTKFSSPIAEEMSSHLGYTITADKVKRKLIQVQDRAHITMTTPNKTELFCKAVLSTLSAPESSSQSGSTKQNRSKSSVHLSSSGIKAESVAEAVKYLCMHLSVTDDYMCISYAKTFLKDESYLHVFNSYNTIEEQIQFVHKKMKD